ncbi:unnamed protein product [Effrenium voratum]|uniref:Uncharacterized protein n=1 Tax=Effrenium voratum TaxID=2562239 RepID=A0AA36N4Z9_9DINO|nr:unnamed protein product [Effrenium voratum]
MASSSATKKVHWSHRLKEQMQSVMDENTFLKQKVDVLNGELNKLQLRSQSSSSNQAQNPSAGNDQNDEQDGGNDQNDEQDGGNDQNDAQDEDSDPSSGDESTDEGFMTVFIIRDFDINKSYEVVVKPSWRLKTLKSVIVQKWNVCVNDLVFSTGGRTLIPSLTFIDNSTKGNTCIHIGITIKGGGKRAQSGVTKKNKDMELKTLKEHISSSLLRLNAVPNRSGYIDATKNDVLVLVKSLETNPKGVITGLLPRLTKDTLRRLTSEVVSSSTTRASDRCKKVGDIIFHGRMEELDEVMFQKNLVCELVYDALHFCLLSEFGDIGGNISWGEFIDKITSVLSSPPEDDPNNINLEGLGLSS